MKNEEIPSVPESRPRSWVEVRLPNGMVNRVIYERHDQVQHSADLGDAQTLGMEGTLSQLPEEGHERRVMEFLRTEPTNAEIISHAMKHGMSVFNIDAYVPEEATLNRILQIEAEKSAQTGGVNRTIATLAAVGVFSTYLIKKEHPTRRAVLSGIGLTTMMVAISPRIESALFEMQMMNGQGEVQDDFRPNEDSIIRRAQKLFSDISATELRTLFGQIDFIRAFRDLVFAEKTTRMADLAKDRGLSKTAIKCGVAHNGVELALRMSSEERMEIINQVLENLEANGIGSNVTGMIRTSIALLTESRWNAEKEQWDITIHQ